MPPCSSSLVPQGELSSSDLLLKTQPPIAKRCVKKRKSPAEAKNLAGRVSRPECALAAWAQQLAFGDYDPPPGVSLLATLLNVVLALVPIA